ncbi:unnamed protein product [Owenia fusiformis]|uniref:Choline monooxygenase, chloroplastic n=1 Tax=Owenia fusiformis TaxID=6347 RepID=A0A8J1XGU7_OWEFU|nr:unnamed protein product [Owenia fusiformis]
MIFKGCMSILSTCALRYVSTRGAKLAALSGHRSIHSCRILPAHVLSMSKPGCTGQKRSFTEMQREWLSKEVAVFDSSKSVESAVTPPSSWFIDPLFYQMEKSSILRKNWIAVGRTDQVNDVGKFITGSIGDEPFIVTRDDGGTLRGFFNVCRHHATIIMEEDEGRALNFQCPYHGWTYKLDGRLMKATRLKGIKDFKASDFGLRPVQVSTWGPLVFVKLDAEHTGPEPKKILANLTPKLDALGFSDGMKFVKRKTYKVNCNWKVFVDNYLDGGYHVEYAHKDLSQLLSLGSYKTEIHDGYSLQMSKGGDHDEGSSRVGSEVIYAHIYPNVMINRYGPWMDFNYVIPESHDSCNVIFDWFLEEKAMRSTDNDGLNKLINENFVASEKVQDEDIEICNRVQKGLKSMSYDWGRYAPNVEAADYEFHQRLAQQFREYLKI